jgi:hypothetical protein
MTQLVVDAERRGELPPKSISPGHLNGPERPALSELKAAFNLHRLSRALAEAFCQRDLHYPSDRSHLVRNPSDKTRRTPPPEAADRVDEWTARVSQTIFRVLIVGAALAGTYWEPILAAHAHPDPEIKALSTTGIQWTDKTFDFLLSFAAYDLEAPAEAQDALFAPLAEWLLADILGDQQARDAMAARFEKGVGRAEYCQSRDDDWPCPLTAVVDVAGSSHSDAHLVVWELMKMFWVVEQIRPFYGPEHAPVSRKTPWDAPKPAGVSQSPSRPCDSAGEPPPPSAVAVFFGLWRAEHVALPTCPSFAGDWDALMAYPVVPDPVKDDNPVLFLLDTAFLDSKRPNHFEWDCPVAPLELKFFEYCFQRQLNLCFLEHAFQDDQVEFLDIQRKAFIECITVFCHDDVQNRRYGVIDDGDFTDGSGMLTTWPPQTERFYQAQRQVR